MTGIINFIDEGYVLPTVLLGSALAWVRERPIEPERHYVYCESLKQPAPLNGARLSLGMVRSVLHHKLYQLYVVPTTDRVQWEDGHDIHRSSETETVRGKRCVVWACLVPEPHLVVWNGSRYVIADNNLEYFMAEDDWARFYRTLQVGGNAARLRQALIRDRNLYRVRHS